MTRIFSHARAHRHAVSILCLAILTAATLVCSRPVRAEGADGWEWQYDAHLGFTLQHPAGWTVKTTGYTITVQSADHTSFALIEALVHSDDKAQDRLGKFPAAHPTLFPAAHIDRITQQPTEGDQALAALSYKGLKGKTGQARVLCSVSQHSGMLYALAAPSDTFDTEKATLLRILQSLRFGSHPTPPGSKPSRQASPASGLHFIAWTDPREQGIRAEVPQGWNISGGTFKINNSDYREMVVAAAPDNTIAVRIGDASLPLFRIPTRQDQIIGIREGTLTTNGVLQQMVLHFMPAPEFNRWYIERVLKPTLDDIVVTTEQDLPEDARKQTEAKSRNADPHAHAEFSIGFTTFTGKSKKGGKPISGTLITSTVLYSFGYNGSLQPSGWSAIPSLLVYETGEKSEANQEIGMAVLRHMKTTFQEDPDWVEKIRQQQVADTNAFVAQSNAEITRRREAQIKANLETRQRTADLMDSFEKRIAGRDDYQRKFLNYVNEEVSVRNPTTGAVQQVAAGSTNYYVNSQTGQVTGTNSAGPASVSLTPLVQY